MNSAPPPAPSRRVTLNVGGRRFETTVATLTAGGGEHYFASLLRHASEAELSGEIFIDRDGDAFSPLLNYLRTGSLAIPPMTSEDAVRVEADFYCITLPDAHGEGAPKDGLCVRCDGIYLSFGSAAQRELAGEDESGNSNSDVRAYLICTKDGSASLGRREADGQWTALRCRYRCLPGGLFLVHRWEHCEGSSQDEGSEEEGGELADGMGPLELSAVVLGFDFIRVMACRRVGRLEYPFHFFASTPPQPGSAFISQVAQPAPIRPAGRVVISFADDSKVAILVTSSQPGWSSSAVARYSVRQGNDGVNGMGAATIATGRLSPRAAAVGPQPTVVVQQTCTMQHTAHDNLCHVSIMDNGNFSRTVDLVSIGEFGLIEFVQLNAQHEPQLIWHRPMAKTANPWVK